MIKAAQAKLLQIGEVTAQSQVPIKTIRYYEELGLIQSTRRTQGGFRLFSEQVFPRLAFIKQAQSLGLSLQDIKDILRIHDQGQLPCQAVKERFRQKIAALDQQIDQLQSLKAQLQSLMQLEQPAGQPAMGVTTTICPIIENSPQVVPKLALRDLRQSSRVSPSGV